MRSVFFFPLPFLLAACAATRPAPLEKPPIFSQPPQTDPTKVGLGFFSHLDRGKARNHIHADDFVLQQPARLLGLRFWGHPEGRISNENDNIMDFVVRIHAATPEKAPGPILLEQRYAIADTKPSPTGRRAPPLDEKPENEPGAIEYAHEVKFKKPLSLEPHRTYFVSVIAVRKQPDGETWQWSDAILRDGRSHSHPLDNPTWQLIDDTDSAFELLLVP